MVVSTCPNTPTGFAFIFQWITLNSSKWRFFFSQRLGGLVFASLCLCSANAYSNNAILFNVRGLAGVSATVTVLEDKTGQAELPEVSRRTDFTPLSSRLFQPIQLHPVWLRIDLEVPASLVGQSAWLEVLPPYIYDARFVPDGWGRAAQWHWFKFFCTQRGVSGVNFCSQYATAFDTGLFAPLRCGPPYRKNTIVVQRGFGKGAVACCAGECVFLRCDAADVVG